MAKATSKKQIILEYARGRKFERVGEREIRAIGAELRRRLAPNGHITPSYIANVLREAGMRVEYEDRFVDPWMDEPYATRLAGLLKFDSFESAEHSLQQIDSVYRDYREKTDRQGTLLVRNLVLKGKERAESMAHNPKLSVEKRREKEEIAFWFRVWADNVDLFFDWLELRKQSQEFRQRFPARNGNGATGTSGSEN